MNTKQVLEEIRKVLGRHKGSEKELYEMLCAEAEGWNMRLSELEAEEEDGEEV